MDELRGLVDDRGFFTRLEAIDGGYRDRDLTAAVRARVVTRFRRGYYSFGDVWSGLDQVGRHLVRTRAVAHSLGPAVAVSHTSAVLLDGVATWGLDLDRVHVTRLDGGPGRVERDVVHHEGRLSDDDVRKVGDLLVVDPCRAAIEAGTLATAEGALVVLDSLLYRGLATDQQLWERFGRMSDWPRIRHLQVPVRMADGGAESPGESRGRWLFWRTGLPAPICQYEVRAPDGTLVGTCDWGWLDRGVLGEFDGRMKYGRLLQPGQDVGEVVFAEKQREDRIRELTDCRMVRLVWADLDRYKVTSERIRSKLLRAA